ncbi:MAG: Holliday junction branch migration protein RuvA [Candidatus Dormibacteria bacterium]
MIAALRGRVLSLEDDGAVVEAGGVGYGVFCHLRTLAALHEMGDREVSLHIHTSVSDDAIRLYGFLSREELRLFRLLIGVERIGPKAALGVLGRAELPTLVRALRSGDTGLLATVPGIGRKTAERVVLELGDKLEGLLLPGDIGSPSLAALPAQSTAAALEGLRGLGFREPEARAALVAAAAQVGEEADVAALIGAALRLLDRVPA